MTALPFLNSGRPRASHQARSRTPRQPPPPPAKAPDAPVLTRGGTSSRSDAHPGIPAVGCLLPARGYGKVSFIDSIIPVIGISFAGWCCARGPRRRILFACGPDGSRHILAIILTEDGTPRPGR